MIRGVENAAEKCLVTVLPENPEHFLFGDQPPSGERFRGCEVAVGTIIADRPRTDPHERSLAHAALIADE